MAFNIVIDPTALKELKKIKKGIPQVFSRLIKSIDSLANNPFDGKPLQGNKKGCFSLGKFIVNWVPLKLETRPICPCLA